MARTPSFAATATSIWPLVLDHAVHGALQRTYEGGRVDAERFVPARWELLPEGRYMWGSVQTVRGCPKHCSFCSVWRTDGQKPRQRRIDSVVDGDRRTSGVTGYRFIAPGRRQLLSRHADGPGHGGTPARTGHGSSSCRRCGPRDSS